MTTVVLAEKPSVARDIARVLGAGTKRQGYLEGNGYRITWALGHLVHFAEPDDYGPHWKGRWSTGQLPMIPDNWKLRLDRKTSDQFKIVKGLITAADTSQVVCATDAGREGEHIFRLIYQHARCRKPFQRLWISSLTPEAIRDGFNHLKPGSAFDALGRAARARAQADWLVGMNLTRAYTVHNQVLCTIGRVQTPTLAMIVKRDAEIAAFKKILFWELLAHFAEGFDARYIKDGKTRIEKLEDAEQLHARLEPHKTGTVKQVEKKTRRIPPPPLYDLTSLQRDANRRLGLTAAQTLQHAQALYETYKLISYPRTESRHISEDLVPTLPGILERLQHPEAKTALARLQQGHQLSRSYVDKTKLTDHHAILPTGTRPGPSLSPILRKVYDLIVERFVSIFLPVQIIEDTEVLIDIGGADFIARGARLVEQGWRKAVAGGDRETTGKGGEDAEQQALPPLKQGQELTVDQLEVKQRETRPPRPYTDATLLSAMKNAGREIDDDDLARAMKGSGLGTPATRAEMIEKLVRIGYVERQRKQLRATEKGQGLIALVAESLRSPEMTAHWEQQLKEVEDGQRPDDEFYQGIVAFLTDLVPRVARGATLSPEQLAAARRTQGTHGKGRGGAAAKPTNLGQCPLCQQGEIVESPKAYGCSRFKDGCRFTIWKSMSSHRLTKAQVKQLLKQGRTAPISGFKSRAGKPFTASLKLEDGQARFDFGGNAAALPPVTGSAVPGGQSVPMTEQQLGAGIPATAQQDPTSHAKARRREGSKEAGIPETEQQDQGSHAKTRRREGSKGGKGGEGSAVSKGSKENKRSGGNEGNESLLENRAHGGSGPSNISNSAAPACPKCGLGQIIEGRRGYGCNRYREGCNFVVWKEIAGLRLTEQQIHGLISERHTPVIAGFTDARGGHFSARIELDEDLIVRLMPAPLVGALVSDPSPHAM